MNQSQDISLTTLTGQQIETLQHLIRSFKSLGKRFSESAIPNLIDKYTQGVPQPQQIPLQAPQPVPLPTMQPPPIPANPLPQYSHQTQPLAPKLYSKNEKGYQHDNKESNTLVKQPTVESKGHTPLTAPSQTLIPTPAPIQPSGPQLSWQCYHSLLSVGYGKTFSEGGSSLFPSVQISSITYTQPVLCPYTLTRYHLSPSL
ncbi:hypothetical protein EON64_11070 [archaeon]|nr:MAG: hypothetical protein EON64_11070 [archaeon]